MRLGLGLSLVQGRSRASVDALALLKSFGNLELLVDAIAGMTHNGTNVTALTDLSPNARTITLVQPPLASATLWNGAQPGMRFTVAGVERFTWPLGIAIPQPFTLVSVIGAQTLTGGQAGIQTTNSSGMQTRINAAGAWEIFAGSVFTSAQFSTVNSTGRYVRIDVFNGASSLICRSGTEETGNCGTGRSINTITTVGVGAPFDAALFAVYSRVLNATERAAAVAALAARYSGVSAT